MKSIYCYFFGHDWILSALLTSKFIRDGMPGVWGYVCRRCNTKGAN